MADIQGDSGGYGTVARVRKIVGTRIFIKVPNGNLGWVDHDGSPDLQEGQTIIIFNDRIEEAPEELWPEEPQISVVRIKTDEFTVLEYAGQTRLIPTNDTDYSKDNTVEFLPTGVLRVLDTVPLSLLELPDITDAAIQAFKVSTADDTITFDDFGGLQHIVARARKLIETPLKYRDRLAEIGAPLARGVLFVGQPGTGKTMLARIIARESGAALYQVNGPEIVSKWLGQSEELLRKIFAHAQAEPNGAIIFFDEIDSIAEERRDDSHEASRRLVAQLLTLMDSCNRANASNVIVIGTTNRIDAIEPALRRPGRFDWEIFFPLPDADGREQVLRASSRHLKVADNLPYRRVAELTDSWTPADLAGIWKEAALLAVTDNRSVIMAEDFIGGYQWVDNLKMRAKDAG